MTNQESRSSKMSKQESGYRWVVLAGVFLAYFLILSQRTAPGVITDHLMQEFHVSASIISLATSLQFLAYAGVQIPIGLLSDRYGPNRFLIAGILLTGIGTLIYSFAPNEYILIFARLLFGLGDAMIFLNMVLILGQWFQAKEFVKLIGMVALVASLASLSATVPLSLWISVAGWRTPFLVVGLILAVYSFLLFIVLVWKPKKLFKEDVEAANSRLEKEGFWLILRQIFSSRQAWALFFCHFGMVGTYIGFIGSWGVPYGIDVFGISRSAASLLVMYGLIGSMLGGPLVGWITSRLGSIKGAYLFVHVLVLLSWTGLFVSGVQPSFMMVVVFFFIIGFGAGTSSLTFALVRQSFPNQRLGVVSGFANSGGFLSAVLLPVFFGGVLDLFPQESITVGYHYGFVIAILFSLIGLCGIILFKETKEQ